MMIRFSGSSRASLSGRMLKGWWVRGAAAEDREFREWPRLGARWPDVIRVPLMLVIVPHSCTYSRGVWGYPSLPREVSGRGGYRRAACSPRVGELGRVWNQLFERSAHLGDMVRPRRERPDVKIMNVAKRARSCSWIARNLVN